MYLPIEDRLKLLVVEDSKTELNLAYKIISPFHDVDISMPHRATEKMMSAQSRRYDWVFIGDVGSASQIKQLSPIKTAEDLARVAQRSGIHAATIQYIDILKPRHSQSFYVKVFDRRSGTPIKRHKIEREDKAFLHFDLAYRPIYRSTFEDMMKRIEDLKVDPYDAPEEFTCRNWLMILEKVGIPLVVHPPAIQAPPKKKFGSTFLERRKAMGSRPKGM